MSDWVVGSLSYTGAVDDHWAWSLAGFCSWLCTYWLWKVSQLFNPESSVFFIYKTDIPPTAAVRTRSDYCKAPHTWVGPAW